jgi:hypothetical protein
MPAMTNEHDDRPCAFTDCGAQGEHWHNGFRYWSCPPAPNEAVPEIKRLRNENQRMREIIDEMVAKGYLRKVEWPDVG